VSPFVAQPQHASILDPSSLFVPAGCRVASLRTASASQRAAASWLAVSSLSPMHRPLSSLLLTSVAIVVVVIVARHAVVPSRSRAVAIIVDFVVRRAVAIAVVVVVNVVVARPAVTIIVNIVVHRAITIVVDVVVHHAVANVVDVVIRHAVAIVVNAIVRGVVVIVVIIGLQPHVNPAPATQASCAFGQT